jgi:FkbM family methyltransferase
MLVDFVKRNWFFEKAEKIKNLVLESLARIEDALARSGARQADQEALLKTALDEIRRVRDRSDVTGEQMAAFALRLGEVERVTCSDLARLQELVRNQPGHLRLHPMDEEPEIGLVSHLGPLLSHRIALDIGANTGKYSHALLEAGFEVHAFEPNPSVLGQLRARFNNRQGFSAHGFALGAREDTLRLNLLQDSSPGNAYGDVSTLATLTRHSLPSGLSYTDSVEVPVRTLASVHQEGLVPAAAGYVKVDTEGFDLEVVRGMGPFKYPMVSLEFWDAMMEFGKTGAQNRLSDLSVEMQGRAYRWWIVIYRVWGENTVRFYCNMPQSIERSWGNVFFFQDHALFAEAERWCSAVLPRTYLTAALLRETGAEQVP